MCCDDGSEYAGATLLAWAQSEHQARLHPTQQPAAECLYQAIQPNGRLRMAGA